MAESGVVSVKPSRIWEALARFGIVSPSLFHGNSAIVRLGDFVPRLFPLVRLLSLT